MTKSDLLLERADRSLRSAEILLKEGDAESAASRIYYTCFYTAQALLATRDLTFSRHGQVIAQYGRYFSKTRLLDPQFQKLLKTTFELREMADYQVEVPIESEVVGSMIPECRQFIAAAARYLESLKTPPDEGEPGPPTP